MSLRFIGCLSKLYANVDFITTVSVALFKYRRQKDKDRMST